MGWPALLVFVRHAESEGNLLDKEERPRFSKGTQAYALTERGKLQARLTGEWLTARFNTFDVYYVSYYERAHETMRLMFPKSVHVYEDPRLAEGQRGIWHTMTRAEIQQQFPHEIERKRREGLYHYRPLGGENWPDIEMRVHSFLGTLARDYEGKRVIVVTHGHWLVLLQRLIHHFSIEESIERYRAGIAANASVMVYRGIVADDGKARLQLEDENIIPWEGLLDEDFE